MPGDFTVPDRSHDIEALALSAMVIDAEACYQGLTILTEEHFTLDRHRYVFRAIRDCYDESEVGEWILVYHRLCAMGKQAEVGGVEWILSLRGLCSSPRAAIVPFCRKLGDLLRLRQLKREFERGITALSQGDEAAAAQVIEKARLIPAGARPERALADILEEVVGDVEREREKPVGWSTGLPQLDAISGRFLAGSSYVIAARTHEGKTALAIQMALDVAIQGGRVLYFSKEMAEKSLARRALQVLSGISCRRRDIVRYTDQRKLELRDWVDYFKRLPFRIDDTRSDLDEMMRKVRSLRGELDLIVIDNLQNVRVRNVRPGDICPRVEAVSQGAKDMAKDTGSAVIGLSQFNQLSSGEEPQEMRNLKGGTSISQDADVVIFVKRDDYGKQSLTGSPGNLIVKKNRDEGLLGTVRVYWNPESARFTEFDFESTMAPMAQHEQ